MLSKGDLNGDAVNFAARVAAIARSGKTLISGYTYNQLTKASRRHCSHFTTTTVKGKEQPIDIYDVAWEQTEELTGIVGNKATDLIQSVLTIQYEDNVIEISAAIATTVRTGVTSITIRPNYFLPGTSAPAR